MRATSFLLGILVIIGAHEVRQVSSTSRDFLETLQLLDSYNCDDHNARMACALMPYRTFDGTCNNLCNITRGAIFHRLQRLETLEEPTAYEPGFEPRSRSFSHGPLPNARTVSRGVFVSSSTLNINGTAPNFTHLTMTWGQFLDHDITLTEVEEAECGTNEEVCPIRPECISINILPGDELEVNPNFKCIPTPRSFRDRNGEQVNIITSYIDGSQVYGSTLEVANRLRGPNGFLDVRPFRDFGNDEVLPPDDETFCRSVRRETEPCFLAGDIRSNENHALTTMHVVWVREHNRIVRALRSLNPQWSDERLFQEARKIVGAELQHITYNEWLPVLFDEDLRRRSGLLLEGDGQFFEGYDPRENAEMINSFSTAALRMGHSLVRNEFRLLDTLFRSRGFPEPEIPVKDFYDPAPFFREGNNPFGGIMNGLVALRARQVDHIFAPAVREFLNFEGPGFNGSFGDLMALNINRGRDHGLPPYVEFREACGARPAHRFSDLLDTTSQDRINVLKSVYNNVKDIDLFPGAMNENPTTGSVLGFTFTCIITKQFNRTRRGDRFWYERGPECGGFTLSQLTEIRKVTMARVLCDNVGLTRFVPRKVFEVIPNRRAVSCDSLPIMDLGTFREGYGAGESEAGEGESNAPVGA